MYLTRAGKASTRYAAMGPYTMHTQITWTNIKNTNMGRLGFVASLAGTSAPVASADIGVKLMALVTLLRVDRTVTTLFPAALSIAW